MTNKLKVGVIFGGRSGEHEVSLVSATSIINALDKNKYEVTAIGITKDGRWFAGSDVLELFKSAKTPGDNEEVSILPAPNKKGLFHLSTGKITPLDVIFPVLHGTFGEDGTIQGLFEMAGLPYVGAGVIGSSVGMDKIVQKDIAKVNGINVSPAVWFLSQEFKDEADKVVKRIESELKYPLFVKPANSGSSVGISKAHDRNELKESIADAVRYDRRVIVENSVEKAREIEVAVLGNDDLIASVPGEVVPSNEFYDYDAKYVDGKSKTLIPAGLPKDAERKVREMAIKAFKMLDLCGMARVDFLVTKSGVYFNEVNTIPGFTSISMYPKLMEASGVPYSKLLDELIALAIARFEQKSKLLTSYQPKEKWYK